MIFFLEKNLTNLNMNFFEIINNLLKIIKFT